MLYKERSKLSIKSFCSIQYEYLYFALQIKQVGMPIIIINSSKIEGTMSAAKHVDWYFCVA